MATYNWEMAVSQQHNLIFLNHKNSLYPEVL